MAVSRPIRRIENIPGPLYRRPAISKRWQEVGSAPGFAKAHQTCRSMASLVNPAQPGTLLGSSLETQSCGDGRSCNVGLIGRLLKQQRWPLAKDVTLAANEPEPVLQFVALGLMLAGAGRHIA